LAVIRFRWRASGGDTNLQRGHGGDRERGLSLGGYWGSGKIRSRKWRASWDRCRDSSEPACSHKGGKRQLLRGWLWSWALGGECTWC
jgi:hypothetical protein